MYWISGIIIFAILLAVGIWFLQKFYAKATLETALVRTGMGGRRVLTDGGCLALPIVHQLQRVSMQTATRSSRTTTTCSNRSSRIASA